MIIALVVIWALVTVAAVLGALYLCVQIGQGLFDKEHEDRLP